MIGFCLFKPPVLAATFAGLVALLAVFAGAEKSNEWRDASLASGELHSSIVTARTFMRVTPDGAMPDYKVEPKAASVATRSSKNSAVRPSGNTLWMVDDQDAMGFCHGREHRIEIQGTDGAEVNDLDGDFVLLLEHRGGGE